jgi:hypothetical protein
MLYELIGIVRHLTLSSPSAPFRERATDNPQVRPGNLAEVKEYAPSRWDFQNLLDTPTELF